MNCCAPCRQKPTRKTWQEKKADMSCEFEKMISNDAIFKKIFENKTSLIFFLQVAVRSTFENSDIHFSSTNMNLEKVQYLLTNPEEAKAANCYTACLFAHDLVTTLDALREKDFERILFKHFSKINPAKTKLQKGDILCMCYFCNWEKQEISYQHAFCYWDEHTVFQKSGPSLQASYKLCSIIDAVLPYSSRQAASMLGGAQNWENAKTTPISKFFKVHSCNYVYRRKSAVISDSRSCLLL